MTVLLLTGQAAYSQDLESLVMPGPVTESHAELETECSSCHKTFDKAAQRDLCMDCHEDVALDVRQGLGLHGKHPDVGEEQCRTCHSDHLGRDADIASLDEDTFDHQFTDFALMGQHSESDCENCHNPGDRHSETPSECYECHAEDNVHDETMGTMCGDCHTPDGWEDATFDHDTTGWPLIGHHMETACDGCHEDQTFLGAPTGCYDCHAEDDAHDGRSGNECGNCHSPTDWTDTSFDHARDTDFALLGKHGVLTCGDCHSDDPFSDVLETTCVSCHLEDDAHEGVNGDTCDNCHTPVDWTETTFDHDTQTGFVLRGGHRAVACNDCHLDPIAETLPGTTCESCHLDDEPHDGTLTSGCASCHTEVNWRDPVFFDHGLTAFPLLGVHTEYDCADCHEGQAFGRTDGECVACHREDDVHEGNFHTRCNECHNPVAWDIWSFDHEVRTEFALLGAHSEVACEACHRVPLDNVKAIDNNCRNCHRADDVHDGEFGFDCGRCHTSNSFSEVESLQ